MLRGMIMRCLFTLYLFVICVTAEYAQALPTSAVTFRLNGGRLGDNLKNFWKAKYFAEQNNIPLLCPSFPYANKLALGNLEKKYTNESRKKFSTITYLKNDFNKTIYNNTNTLYIVDYYFKSKHGPGYHDPHMVNLMKKYIRPVKSIKSISLKKNCINIALHVRRGSGPDSSFLKCQKIWPSKFPPYSFYVTALEKASELYGHRAIHVHIFTDATTPSKIARKLERKLSYSNISFSYRQENKKAHANSDQILEDLFSMAKCDCLIRGSSGLAHIAQLIGNHKVIITPQNLIWKQHKLLIQQLGIINHL